MANSFIQNMLSKFTTRKDTMTDFNGLMQTLRAAQKVKRKYTYKPAFSMGFRGAPRTTKPTGMTPAPTIDQVRNIERAYLCRIHVKNGVMYFKNTSTAFTPERGKKHRMTKLAAMAKEVGCEVPSAA